MSSFCLSILCFALYIVYSFSATISPPSGDVCEGDTASFDCTVNGTLLWRDGRNIASFSSVIRNEQPLGLFTTVLVSICTDGLVTSRATASSVTSTATGTVIECQNGANLSESSNITLNVKNTSAATLVNGKANKISDSFEVSITVSWQEATCATRYEIIITNETGLVELNTTTTETAFVYSVPSNDHDCYTFSVYSIDFFGMRVGSPASTRVGVRFIADEVVSEDSAILLISILNRESMDCQSPFMFCNISLTNDTFHSNISSCSQGEFDVIIGGTYDYTVTVVNFLGPRSINDSISIAGPLRTTITGPLATVTVTPIEPQRTFSTESTSIITVFGFLLFVMTVLLAVVLLGLLYKRHCGRTKHHGTNAVVGKDISLIQGKLPESPNEKAN